MTGEAQRSIETFLERLRSRLLGMNADDVHEIVEEFRSHILDKAAGGGEVTLARVEAALAALGSPEDLAGQYVTCDLLARAEVSRSPVQILHSLFRWASLSVGGLIVLASSLLGYFLSFVFMLLAVLKPFHPKTAGLWILPGGPDDLQISFRLGFADPPPGGRELLGWWIVPIGLLACCGLLMLTTRFALWCGRQYRKSRELPAS
jgi:hypothetical protein